MVWYRPKSGLICGQRIGIVVIYREGRLVWLFDRLVEFWSIFFYIDSYGHSRWQEAGDAGSLRHFLE